MKSPTFRSQALSGKLIRWIALVALLSVVPAWASGPAGQDVSGPRSQDKYIWDVVGQDYAETQRITYGRVQKGFVQKVPRFDRPPALVPGVQYEVYAHTRDAGTPATSFVYQRAENPHCSP